MTPDPTTPRWDVAVIGAGPAGLSAAVAAGRAGRSVIALDTGTPRNRFATTMHTVLGFDGRSPAELSRTGLAEARSYGVEIRSVGVTSVQRHRSDNGEDAPDTLSVHLEDGTQLITRAVIAASGVTDVLPEIPGLAEHWGSTVLHCPYCHGWEVRGGRLGVLGTGPLSLHQVQLIRQWSPLVAFFSAACGELDLPTVLRLEAREITLEPDSVARIAGAPGGPLTVHLREGAHHEVDALFLAPDTRPRDGYLEGLDLARVETPFGAVIDVDPQGRTSHPRIWAAGNIVAPAANVAMSLATGTLAGAMANMALVDEDFDLAEATPYQP
ncbi:MAG: NAD(P)/FAD-dependent oxidoreductase [Micrococcaceae bacterium]